MRSWPPPALCPLAKWMGTRGSSRAAPCTSARDLVLPTSPHMARYGVTSTWPVARFPSTQKKEAAPAVAIYGISPTWWDHARDRQCRHRVGAAVSQGQTDLGKPVPWQDSSLGSPHAAHCPLTFPCPRMGTVSSGSPVPGRVLVPVSLIPRSLPRMLSPGRMALTAPAGWHSPSRRQ